MQKTTFLLGLFVIVFLTGGKLYAQVSEGGTPPSFTYPAWTASQQTAPVRMSAGFDVQKQIAADNKELEGTVAVPLKMGKVLPADLNMENSGEWLDLPDGTRIWRLTVQLPEALATMLYYDRFEIPEGGKLFIYSADRRQVLGAYTSKTNVSHRLFATELLRGDVLTLEYVSPGNSGSLYTKADKPQIHITGIVYVYNYVDVYDRNNGVRLRSFGDAGSCEVNVNCEEGSNWQDQKKGVVKTISTMGKTTYLCSGTVINNVVQDLKPYYLSAWHCFGTQTESELEQTVFYFHYESASCATGQEEPSDYKTLVGADVLVLNPMSGGSDGALLLLKDQIPSDYDVYYNGWDVRNMAPTSGVGIHHPHGDVKKISTYSSPPESSTWMSEGVGAYNAHWNVRYIQTANGWGVTEPGSSGSPLFNQNGLVVGTLTGGNAECLNTTGTNQYGKLWYHWDQSSDASRHMKSYLDPYDTGVDVLAGTYRANNTPSAAFRASASTIYALESITYTNQSIGAVSYQWTFEGGIPASASERNPAPVVYSNPGTYTTTLIINKGTSTETSKSLTVTVDIKGGVAIQPVADFTFLRTFYSENFDGETFPPAGWSMEKKGTGNKLWFTENLMYPDGLNFSLIDPENITSALINFDEFQVVDSWLLSPTWQIPPAATLEFYAGYSSRCIPTVMLNLLVSTDDGLTWTEKWTNGPIGIPGVLFQWYKITVNMDEFAGKNVRLAWQYLGLGCDMGGLDNVKIIAPLPSGTPATLYVGDYAYPVDLSSGPAVLYDWKFENGMPDVSKQEKPVVRYWKAGNHEVSLQVKNTAGEDRRVVPNAVQVLAKELEINCEARGGYTLYPDCGQFIPVGSSIRYIDKTVNYPMEWNWTFEGGTPAGSTEQNPSVLYSEEGSYGFNFTATNTLGEKNISIPDFVQVGGEAKIWNLEKGEKGQETPSDWLGYTTGTSAYSQTHYAERFEAPLVSAAIAEVNIAFMVAAAKTGSLEVSIMSDNEGYPGTIIDKVNVPVSDIQSTGYTTIRFNHPVPVSGPFFISVGNFWNAPFQIAIKHEERFDKRKTTFKNTAYVYHYNFANQGLGHGPGWFSFSEYAKDTYISMNIVPTVLYGSYMTVDCESGYQRKSTDNTVTTINVHSNISWQATASADWIDITSDANSFSFTVKENTNQARIGMITVGIGEFQRKFVVEQAGPPATSLTVASVSNGAELKWKAPAYPTVKQRNIGWSNGDMYGIHGPEDGGRMEVACRFTPEDLAMHHRAAIKEVEVSIGNLPANRKLTLKLHQGGKVIYSQAVEVSDIDFVSILLTDDVYIDSSQDLYIGYEYTQLPGLYVAGADEGPGIYGKGDLVSEDGGKTFYSIKENNIDGNWIIIVWLDPSSRLDYLVYRDNQLTGTTTGLTYIDPLQAEGNYCYKVVARYDKLLPTVDSNIACVEYKPTGLEPVSAGNMKLYPNPVNDLLMIDGHELISAVTVTNTMGQIMYDEKQAGTLVAKKSIDTSSWLKGIYIVRIRTAKNEMVYKVVKQ